VYEHDGGWHVYTPKRSDCSIQMEFGHEMVQEIVHIFQIDLSRLCDVKCPEDNLNIVRGYRDVRGTTMGLSLVL
jgi:hypothetical protein